MKSIVALIFLLAIPYVLCEDRQCIRASGRVDFENGTPVSFRGAGRTQTCPTSEYGCGAVRKFAVSIRLNDAGTGVASGAQRKSYSTLDMGCVPPTVCAKIVGGSDGIGCRYADYTWARYDPITCNATNDFDAVQFRQRVRMYYACCNADDCFTANDATQTNAALNGSCSENTALGEYIGALHTCWNGGREAFRQYFICDGAPLVEFREVCRDDVYGDWDFNLADSGRGSDGEACRYRPTCSQELQTLIESFGECACGAATELDFTGEAIGSLMETMWNRFCPQIEISCAGDSNVAGGLLLRQRRRRRQIKVRVAQAVAYFTEAKIIEWREKIADYLRCQNSEDDIQISVAATESGNGNGRRLLPDSTDVILYVLGDDGFNDAINTAACDQDGLRTTFDEATLVKISCLYDDVVETLAGQETVTTSTTSAGTTMDGGDASSLVYMVAVMVGLLGYLMQ
jgi:hypothetical protein